MCVLCARCAVYLYTVCTVLHTGPTWILIQVLLSFSPPSSLLPRLSSPVYTPPSLLPLLSPRYVDPSEQRSSCSTGWNRTLRHLYMHSNRFIADDTAAVLIKSLRHHPTIVDVGLTDTKVSSAKQRLIDRSLQTNQACAELHKQVLATQKPLLRDSYGKKRKKEA